MMGRDGLGCSGSNVVAREHFGHTIRLWEFLPSGEAPTSSNDPRRANPFVWDLCLWILLLKNDEGPVQ